MTSPPTATKIALLPDRGMVHVTGEDAEKLLQGVITGDMERLSAQPAIHAALLTPQGKILFDFFVVKTPTGFLLETAVDKAADLAKRLRMYKLRAKAEIEDRSDDYCVLVAWGPFSAAVADAGTQLFPDPRLAALGCRAVVKAGLAPDVFAAVGGQQVAPTDYHAHRIALGVPEGGKDYAFGDAFPHEADLDQLHGVSFTKGCFIGQEVVSRMQNRATVRKRVVPVEGDGSLVSGTEIRAGEVAIGTVGSVAGRKALALLRLDRAAEAKSKGQMLTSGGVAVTVRKPEWAAFTLAPAEAAGAS